MTLLVRLSLLLGAVLAAIAGALWLNHRTNELNLSLLLDERREDRARFFERAVTLQGVGLETLASSYSWWKDMVLFVERPNATWANETVDTLVGSPVGCDALWIFDTDFELLHRLDGQSGRPAVPFASEELLRRQIGERYQFSYFIERDGQVWQIFGAAIQDPMFWRHETPIRGFLLLGKHWDGTWMARLSDLTQSRLEISAAANAPDLPDRSFARPLRGLDGAPVAHVVGTVDARELEAVRQAMREQLLLVAGGLVLLAGIVALTFGVAVVQPLNSIVRSLESRSPAQLVPLLHARTPFGEVARMLASQFRQGRMLQEEIRRHLEASHPAPTEAESVGDLRLRLASDLHDGPLQSIYAAGLKLGALEKRVASGQLATPVELESIRGILTECTANLRNLLFNLEPEELRQHDLEAALDRLERYMRSIAGEFMLRIEDHALDGFGREAQVNLFYICRELVSNAARHASPRRASLTFKRSGGFLLVEWINDGIIEPEPGRSRGNGLRNIEQRVKRLDGSCQQRVQRGRLWTVTIELPYTSLITPLTLEAPGTSR